MAYCIRLDWGPNLSIEDIPDTGIWPFDKSSDFIVKANMDIWVKILLHYGSQLCCGKV